MEAEVQIIHEIDPDDVKSDFDEIKGLGCPSVDSFTMDTIDI